MGLRGRLGRGPRLTAPPPGTSPPPAALFITRKYPPSVGGMQEFSRGLIEHYPGQRNVLALTASQRRLPLFFAQALARARAMHGRVGIVHVGDAMSGAGAPEFARLSGAPVVVTLHGRDVLRDPPGYHALLRRGLAHPMVRCVAVSEDTADHARRLLGVEAAVIHNGVDRRFGGGSAEAARWRLSLPPGARLIVTVARLEPRKGQAWFARHVMPRLPEDVFYAVAGAGPDADALLEAAAHSPRTRLLGPIPDADVADLYAAADLVVAPNVEVPGDSEGYGIAPAEAAAAGAPVLVSHLEGLRDMAEDFGVLTVPPDNPDAWARVVAKALLEPPRATRVRTWPDVARDYARFFAATVSGADPGTLTTA